MSKPDSKDFRAILGGEIHCPDCGIRLLRVFTNRGEVVLQHPRPQANCQHAGKSFNAPTIKLQEIKD